MSHLLPDDPAAVERRKRRLSIGMRILLYGVGWLLLLVGAAGLVLPGLQGIIILALGAAVLSVASEAAYRLLQRLLHRRTPRLWDYISRLREKLHDKLTRK